MTAVSHAQLTLDRAMGTTGALSGPNFVILSTVGQTRDGNLFHSFGLFKWRRERAHCSSVPVRPAFEIYWGHPLKKVETQGGNLQDHGVHLLFSLVLF
jgi:hypothetical protein